MTKLVATRATCCAPFQSFKRNCAADAMAREQLHKGLGRAIPTGPLAFAFAIAAGVVIPRGVHPQLKCPCSELRPSTRAKQQTDIRYSLLIPALRGYRQALRATSAGVAICIGVDTTSAGCSSPSPCPPKRMLWENCGLQLTQTGDCNARISTRRPSRSRSVRRSTHWLRILCKS